MDDEELDEREVFSDLALPERCAICLLLDCAKPPTDGESSHIHRWLVDSEAGWGWSLIAAAEGLLRIVPRLADQLAHKEDWTDAGLNADVFYGKALHIAWFCRMNGLIRTFVAFDFLFVRLFGGAVRPLTPSLFAASLLHPLVSRDPNASEQLEKAVSARNADRGTNPAVWFPREPSS